MTDMQELAGFKVGDRIRAPFPYKGEARVIGFHFDPTRNQYVVDYVTDFGWTDFDTVNSLSECKLGNGGVVATLLMALENAYCIAENYRIDWETGLADGTYDDREGYERHCREVAEIEAAIAQGKRALGR